MPGQRKNPAIYRLCTTIYQTRFSLHDLIIDRKRNITVVIVDIEEVEENHETVYIIWVIPEYLKGNVGL